MDSLVTSNILQRPLRSIISVIGVALGVALVMLFTGLAHGMSNDLQRRSANLRAEIIFTRPGSIQLTSSSTNLSTKYVERLLRQLGEAGYSEMRLETTRIDHSGDMAMEMGRFSVVLRTPTGTLISERGKYVKVWRRLGSWLTIADCWNWTSQAANDRAA